MQAPSQPRPVRRSAPAPAPAPAASRAAFTTRARAVLPRILEDLGELAAYDDPLADDLQRAAIHAQRVMDELGALELSDGKRGRPVPNRAAFDRDGASSAASPTAPPSENRRPRRRAKRDDVTGMDEL